MFFLVNVAHLDPSFNIFRNEFSREVVVRGLERLVSREINGVHGMVGLKAVTLSFEVNQKFCDSSLSSLQHTTLTFVKKEEITREKN